MCSVTGWKSAHPVACQILLTWKKILTGNSAPRNQFLLKYLDNMKYIDGLGRGVPMIARETKGNFLYSEEGEILRLVLPFQAAVPTG